jgi:hypothetical protein
MIGMFRLFDGVETGREKRLSSRVRHVSLANTGNNAGADGWLHRSSAEALPPFLTRFLIQHQPRRHCILEQRRQLLDMYLDNGT